VRLLPRDERFFDLFTKVAELNLEAARLLLEILKTDNERRLPLVEAMKRCEHSADEATHEVVARLDRSFITPLDREDIHMLASRLDDILDIMDGTARRIQIFRPGAAPQGATMIAETIVKSCEQLLTAVRMMEKAKPGEMIPTLVLVKRMEEDGDAIYHEWLGRLFDGSPDPLMVMKWKEIYDNLEKTLDHCEDVANVLESIAIKHG
jgi:predicted phosphate transport protein (TIGR00153 family)